MGTARQDLKCRAARDRERLQQLVLFKADPFCSACCHKKDESRATGTCGLASCHWLGGPTCHACCTSADEMLDWMPATTTCTGKHGRQHVAV